ncbi:hypothetical protein [Shewanella halifaxensis]|uniref:hypothetical protein n=1 Tax=Shewanella halifaxensis TaxID=271098 RepID=UPI000D5975D9|nr:hypothetical protein [Shewanella halifaxensis]
MSGGFFVSDHLSCAKAQGITFNKIGLTEISHFFMAMALSQHLKQPLLHIELSANSLFYMVMGAALLGINKAQSATFYNQND